MFSTAISAALSAFVGVLFLGDFVLFSGSGTPAIPR